LIKGLRPLAGGHDVETFCSGLDGLVERAADYYEQGARFAKWRAVLQITDDGCPSKLSIRENAWGLARYARSVQESGLVPIIEPEILMDGSHSIEKTAAVQEEVIKEVYLACQVNGVLLEGTLLKPSMTVQGADSSTKADPQQVAEMTIRTMERCVPASVPGITFLSGGLSEEAASVYLNLMNKIDRKKREVSFSYGRALQHSCLKA
jgi:Fructose-1,6-bisphosphate aldolase